VGTSCRARRADAGTGDRDRTGPRTGETMNRFAANVRPGEDIARMKRGGKAS